MRAGIKELVNSYGLVPGHALSAVTVDGADGTATTPL
jgi:hypothetical protein